MEINLTENSFIYQSALRLANRELNKAVNLLLEHEDKWNDTLDLKLHDACCASIDFELNNATVTFSDEEQNSWFNVFCETEYDNFKEWLTEEGINSNIMDYAGRTSQFYLGQLHDSYLLDTLAAASYEYSVDNLVITENNDDVLIDEAKSMEYCNDIEDFVNALLSFAESVYSEVEDSLKDIIKVYDYITGFKKNQVENFQDFVKESWIATI